MKSSLVKVKLADFAKRVSVSPTVLGHAIFLISLTLLAISYGVIAQTYKFWPAQLLQRAQMGFLIILGDGHGEPLMLAHKWVAQVPEGKDGVLRYDKSKAYPGYTLYTSLHEPGAVLIDMQGDIVHEWRVDDRDLGERLDLDREFLTGLAYGDHVRLMPDGSLWILVRTFDTVSNAGGLVRLDRDSRVTWSYAASTHHDFDLGPDGTVYVLTNGVGSIEPKYSRHLSGFAILDFIDVVSREGKLRKRISLLDCFVHSPYRHYLKIEELSPRKHDNDLFHSNAVRLVSHEDLNLVPDNGHLHALVSMRTLQVIAIVDLDAEKVVHAIRGPWIRQHDPDVLPDGTMMLFDNLGRIGSETPSRVIRFEPDTGKILWQWPKGPREPFESFIRGSQQPLPNGNVLITESQGARLIEVTLSGTVVWEYRSPIRYQDDDRYRFVVRSGQRFGTLPWVQEKREHSRPAPKSNAEKSAE